ncbi:MAG: hypothetical protein ABFR82_14000 [Nitrospirota bacterium]
MKQHLLIQLKTAVEVTKNQSNNNNSRIQALEALSQDLQTQLNRVNGCTCWNTELLNEVAAALIPVGANGTSDRCSDDPNQNITTYDLNDPQHNRSALWLRVGQPGVLYYPQGGYTKVMDIRRGYCQMFAKEIPTILNDVSIEKIFPNPSTGEDIGDGVYFGDLPWDQLISRQDAQACRQVLMDSDLWSRCNQ